MAFVINGSYCLGAAKKKSSKQRSHEQFSLTFCIRRLYKFQKLFSETIRNSYFFFLLVFYGFLHWNSLGPIEILYGLGGTKMSVFHSLSNLLFNWIPFHKNRFLHKIDSVHFNAQGANNSKSLFIIRKFNLHADIQLLKVRNEQKSLGLIVGDGQMILQVWLQLAGGVTSRLLAGC